VIRVREHLSFRSVGRFTDHFLSLCSPLVFAALIGCGIVWTVEDAPSQTIVSTTTYVRAHTGQELTLAVPVIVQPKSRRSVYRMWLTSESGAIAYIYPDQQAPSSKRLGTADHQLTIPTFIKSGVYILHVEVIYPFNPLKNGTILMSVATLNIE
jgi:hypothetical protein